MLFVIMISPFLNVLCIYSDCPLQDRKVEAGRASRGRSRGVSVPHLMTTSLLPKNLLKKGCQGSLYDQRLLFEAKYNVLPRRTKPAVTVAGLLLNPRVAQRGVAAKCFHVELAESPSRSKLVIWSRDRGAAAHSATIRWKHIAIEALSLVHCPETDQAIRRGLLLLSHPITSIELGDFTAISFSHDGRYAAIAREDLYVNIIELATGQVRS